MALGCSSPLSLVCRLAGLENWSTPLLWGDFKLNRPNKRARIKTFFFSLFFFMEKEVTLAL